MKIHMSDDAVRKNIFLLKPVKTCMPTDIYTSEYMKYRTFGPRRKPEKNSSLNRIRTHDLCDKPTGSW